MNTTNESTSKPAGMPGVLSEAAMFTVVRPSQLRTTEALMSAIDGFAGRSASMKAPLRAKPSLRGWVKRSTSSRTTPAPETAPSESLKAHIKHLGGGRLEQAETKGTASNTTLLAPVPKRVERSRAGSGDSRVTQWLDFYNSPPATSKQSSTQPHTEPLPSGRLPIQQHPLPRPGSNADLRPAPLRVPSAERCKGPSTPPKPLDRKNSKWKPLPSLPAQGLGIEGQPGVGMIPGNRAGAENRKESELTATTSSHNRQSKPVQPDDPGFLPVLQFGTPPPTPDSSTGGAVRMATERDREKSRDTEKQCPAAPRSSDARTRKETQPKKLDGADRIRHTRQERIWLHVNYRGEAPFLQAWGLDITKAADRLEGLAIVRELVQAESEGRSGMNPLAAVPESQRE